MIFYCYINTLVFVYVVVELVVTPINMVDGGWEARKNELGIRHVQKGKITCCQCFHLLSIELLYKKQKYIRMDKVCSIIELFDFSHCNLVSP